jgi:hypothetical protein
MTINSAAPDGSAEAGSGSATVVSPAPPSWPWRRAALFLAGAAQLITISALVGADPIPATWSSLLLAVAPAPVAAAAVGAAVWFDFFFTLPYERFTIRSPADVTTFVLLLVVGVIVSQLAAYARRLKVVAITDAGYLAQIP